MRFAIAAALTLLVAGCGATQEPPEAKAPAALPRASAITVPSAFRAEIYARGLNHPTAMAFGPDGRLYVSQDGGTIVRVNPGTRNPRVLVRNLPTPLGLAWIGQRLYISAQGRIERRTLADGLLGSRRVLVSGLPFGRHQQDNIVVAPNGRLYFGSGSTCDACTEANPRSATILSMRTDGTDLRIVARGLRNPYGLAINPASGNLFASVNGRDDLGSSEPAEMLVRIKAGARYGWPGCWPNWSRKRMSGSCTGVTRPIAYLEPHSAAGGIAFPQGTVFPTRFRTGVFVALWGQYLSTQRGRKVKFVALPSGEVRKFASGFQHPLALAFDSHGALLVADWGRGTIYRIQARGKP